MTAIDYLATSVTLHFGEAVRTTGQVGYDAARQLLLFITTEDTEVLSVNLETYGLTTPAWHVWVKDWSEHTGLTNQLTNLQIATYKITAEVGPFNSPAHLVEITPSDST